MKKEEFKKLTPNRAVNIFFGDGSHEEEKMEAYSSQKSKSPQNLYSLDLCEKLKPALTPATTYRWNTLAHFSRTSSPLLPYKDWRDEYEKFEREFDDRMDFFDRWHPNATEEEKMEAYGKILNEVEKLFNHE